MPIPATNVQARFRLLCEDLFRTLTDRLFSPPRFVFFSNDVGQTPPLAIDHFDRLLVIRFGCQ